MKHDTSDDIGSESLSPIVEKSIWHKLDCYILPVVSIFYFLSFLVRTISFLSETMWVLLWWQDRSNIGNARIAGLQTDLKISNFQYSVALTVTYVMYIAVELPSNLILKVGMNIEFLQSPLPSMRTIPKASKPENAPVRAEAETKTAILNDSERWRGWPPIHTVPQSEDSTGIKER